MQPSSRLPGSLEPNGLSLALVELQGQGTEILDLTASNPTRCGLPYPAPLLRSALGAPEVLEYAPDPRGGLAARQAVAAHLGHGVEPGDLLLTASTSEAYSWLFKLLCDSGDEVLVPSPSYPLFEWLARLEGIRARSVPSFWHERWNLDVAALEAACGPRCRAVVAVNPNNPTGQFLSRAEAASLLDLCARRGLALIVDEVFADYALEPSGMGLPTFLDVPPEAPLFVLSGLSKVAALPQLKLGWIALRGAASKALAEPLAFIADQFLSVSASAQTVAPVALGAAPAIQAALKARLRANLAELDRALEPFPHLSRLRVEGGWSVLLRRPAVRSDGECALELLREAQTLVHPGHFFDLPEGHLVLSLLPEEARFREGLARLLPRA